jgi:hypothetical protein
MRDQHLAGHSPQRPVNEFCGPVVDPLSRDAPQPSAPCPNTGSIQAGAYEVPKSSSSMQTRHGGYFASVQLSVTSDSEEIVKKAPKRGAFSH